MTRAWTPVATALALALGAGTGETAAASPPDGGGGHGAAPGSQDAGAGAHRAGAVARVVMGFSSYAPAQTDAVVGDAIAFVNESVRTHTVTADDGSFDSGRLVGGATWQHRFGAPGTFAYHCTLHPGMRGAVTVARLVLAAPPAPAVAGRAYPLSGRTALAPGTGVAIVDETGRVLATTTVRGDGSFGASVVPRGTVTLRAVAGDATSRPVSLVVRDRRVHAAVHGRALRVRVAPAAPGETVVLQVRLPLRFGWWPVHRARLDRRSTAHFRVPRRPLPVRVALTLPDGATVLAATRPLSHHGAVRTSGR